MPLLGERPMEGIEELLLERLEDQSLPQPLLWISLGPERLSHQYHLLAVRRGWLQLASAIDQNPRSVWLALRAVGTLELCPPDEPALRDLPPPEPPPAVVGREPNGSRRRPGRA